jgi:putative zinc finger protein
MVTEAHPEDVELFDYVEGDLAAGEHARVEAHLASCPRCAERVALVQSGRETLRASQSLELPERSRGELLAGLPSRPRDRRWREFSLGRALALVTPIAAAVAVAVALSTTGGNGDENAAMADTSQAAATATPEAAQGDTGGGQELRGKDERLSFAGPAADVAADLRAQGIDAVALADRVEVRNATRAEVIRALQGRRDGSVRVIIVP